MRFCLSNKFPGDARAAFGWQRRPNYLVSDFSAGTRMCNVHQEATKSKSGGRKFQGEKRALPRLLGRGKLGVSEGK